MLGGTAARIRWSHAGSPILTRRAYRMKDTERVRYGSVTASSPSASHRLVVPLLLIVL
jgi:hypothetical protein